MKEIKTTETLYKSKYLEFKSASFNNDSKWYYVKRTNDSLNHDSAVVITTVVKVNNEYNFIFLKTKRPPIVSENKSLYSLESPAGLIADENNFETLIDCTKKELLEEAGITADKIFIEITNCPTSGGLTSETISYATAISDSYEIVSNPVSDGGIIQDRILVPVNSFESFIRNIDCQKVSVASSLVTGVYFALTRLNHISS